MATVRKELVSLRQRLIRLHKALVEGERVTYERVQGRIATTGELLQLVIHDSWFVWLHPLSGLIVRMDELLDADAGPTAPDVQGIASEARALLTPAEGAVGFGGQYFEALQRDPAVVLAHAEVMRALAERPAQ